MGGEGQGSMGVYLQQQSQSQTSLLPAHQVAPPPSLLPEMLQMGQLDAFYGSQYCAGGAFQSLVDPGMLVDPSMIDPSMLDAQALLDFVDRPFPAAYQQGFPVPYQQAQMFPPAAPPRRISVSALQTRPQQPTRANRQRQQQQRVRFEGNKHSRQQHRSTNNKSGGRKRKPTVDSYFADAPKSSECAILPVSEQGNPEFEAIRSAVAWCQLVLQVACAEAAELWPKEEEIEDVPSLLVIPGVPVAVEESDGEDHPSPGVRQPSPRFEGVTPSGTNETPVSEYYRERAQTAPTVTLEVSGGEPTPGVTPDETEDTPVSEYTPRERAQTAKAHHNIADDSDDDEVELLQRTWSSPVGAVALARERSGRTRSSGAGEELVAMGSGDSTVTIPVSARQPDRARAQTAKARHSSVHHHFSDDSDDDEVELLQRTWSSPVGPVGRRVPTQESEETPVSEHYRSRAQTAGAHNNTSDDGVQVEVFTKTSPCGPVTIELSGASEETSPGGKTPAETEETPVSEHYRARAQTAAAHNNISDDSDDDEVDAGYWSV